MHAGVAPGPALVTNGIDVALHWECATPLPRSESSEEDSSNLLLRGVDSYPSIQPGMMVQFSGVLMMLHWAPVLEDVGKAHASPRNLLLPGTLLPCR